MRKRPYGKVRRPTAEDYAGVRAQMDMSKAPTYDEFMGVLTEMWEGQFTAAEKRGLGAGVVGPVNFKQFLQESRAVLIRQRDEVIPEKYSDGLLSKEDMVAATELAGLLIEYEERALRSMED